jgi:hypothetical protein
MRPSRIARAVSATAAVLLLTACSGGSDDESASSTSSAASSSAAESSSEAPESSGEAPASDSEFCTEATQINERISTSLSETDSDSLSQNLQTISDEIGAVEPPAEIADDWNTLADALGQAAGALDGVDLTDPEQAAQAQAELGDLQTQLGDAGTNVEAYLREQCGIDTDGTATASEPAAPSS